MKIEQFLEELARIFSMPGGQIKIGTSGAILVRIASDNWTDVVDSPITAVAHALKPDRPHWLCTASGNAGKEIDLSEADTSEIDAACWKIDGYRPELRAKILLALRVEDRPTSSPSANAA